MCWDHKVKPVLCEACKPRIITMVTILMACSGHAELRVCSAFRKNDRDTSSPWLMTICPTLRRLRVQHTEVCLASVQHWVVLRGTIYNDPNRCENSLLLSVESVCPTSSQKTTQSMHLNQVQC